MKNIIYYPSFESDNLTWIKFSLLYFNKQRPIVPISGDQERSDLYRLLLNETDLFEMYRPAMDQGHDSTLDAIEITEKILDKPYSYDRHFGHNNPVKQWQVKELQSYKIYQEKFSHEWFDFCLKNGFGIETKGGILVNESLGALYMTVLANTIADAEGMPALTDIRKLYKLTHFVRRNAPIQTKELSNAQSIMELKMPAQLHRIPLKEIIELRKTNSFIKSLNSFHSELEKFYSNVEMGTENIKFVQQFDNALTDYSDHFLKISANTVKFIVGAGLLVSSAYTNSAFFKEIIVAGTALAVDSIVSVKTTWRNTQTKRNCRNYLTSLSNFHPVKPKPKYLS